MAEGGHSRPSSDNLSDILSDKSTSSSDSEIDVNGCIPGNNSGPDKSMIPPAPPLPLASAAAACAAIAGEMQGLDRLLQKQRNDRMFELRKLKHSERPVSSTDNKERLEKFFAQSSEPASESRQRAVRPDSVRVEVSGLSERRPVSSVLSSNSFRQDLEDIIRGNLVRQEREVETAVRLRTAGLTVHQSAPIVGNDAVSQLSETLSGVSSHVSSVHSSGNSGEYQQQWNGPYAGPQPSPGWAPPGGPPQMSPGFQQPPWQQNMPWQQQQQAWSQWQQSMAMQRPPWQQPWQQQSPWQRPPWQQQPSWQQPPWSQQPQSWQQAPRQQLPQQQAQMPPVLPQQPWLVQDRNQPPAAPQQQQRADTLTEVTQQHRENIVTEISDLVHRQLVSNTLESNFRVQMENLMESRLNASESDGIAVMEAVRSLPQNPAHRRNDFSHLGIQSPSQHQADGHMGGATAMTWGGAEFDALRRQMEELQSVVRLSFDLQLDMQRAIRQEVSAALSSRSSQGSAQASGDSEDGNPADVAASIAQNNNRPASEGSCLICLDSSVDTVLYQCGHMCVCLSCGMRLKGMGAHCPMCRAPIRDVIRAYRCQQPE